MCGICGISYFDDQPADTGLVRRMCDTLLHRGPDEEGLYFDGGTGLGMRRLSIIDLGGGSQPMFNETGDISVVFNGEIYNFEELRNSLESRGHTFVTRCDTEVIPHLYEEYGLDFPKQLNGMFGIALWDRKLQRLVLVRDRLGQKPLYYAQLENGVVFGSELNAVMEAPGVSCDLGHEAVYHYLTLGYIPNPWSIYKQVRQLPPGGRLVVSRNVFHVDRYWEPPCEIDTSLDQREACDALRELVADAVRIRMISDVPLGAFLSGGIDSSVIVAKMAQQSAVPVKTFHIDFEEPDYSEADYARSVARRYGTEHHELVVESSAHDLLDDLIPHFGEPFADSSALPTYLVSKLTRNHVTVALAGDGGDENFGGYLRYRRILARRSLPAAMRRVFAALGEAVHRGSPRWFPGRRYIRSLGMSHQHYYAVETQEAETREMLHAGFLNSLGDVSTFETLRPLMARADRTDPLSPYSTLDLHHYLPDDILTKVDRMSMANSLELRAPLLDHRIVELAATMPSSWKVIGNDSKVIFKRAFADDLPQEVLRPRKRGFSVPLGKWLRRELRGPLEDAVNDHEIEQSGIFEMSAIRALMREHLSGRRDRSSQLWRYMVFVRWWHQRNTSKPPRQDVAIAVS